MPVKSKRRTYRSEVRAAAADETRGRIIAAARALLAGDGTTPAFSLDAVAREAGVTRLTVYNQFESKRGLLEALFDETARMGGLFELPAVFALSDVHEALRRFVSVFCRFWASHGKLFPKFSALARLDDEIAESIKQRSERRRHALEVLVARLEAHEPQELVDVLFALTSFEVFDLLSARNRSHAAVEALVQQLVAESVKRMSSRPHKLPARRRTDRAPGGRGS